MPVKIFLRGGLTLSVQGDTEKQAIHKRLFSPMAQGVLRDSGHVVSFRKSEILATDPTTQAEADQLEAARLETVAKQKKDQDEERARAEAARAEALKKAAEDIVLKYGPDPEKWPEGLRPKPPVN